MRSSLGTPSPSPPPFAHQFCHCCCDAHRFSMTPMSASTPLPSASGMDLSPSASPLPPSSPSALSLCVASQEGPPMQEPPTESEVIDDSDENTTPPRAAARPLTSSTAPVSSLGDFTEILGAEDTKQQHQRPFDDKLRKFSARRRSAAAAPPLVSAPASPVAFDPFKKFQYVCK
jgi:hypothetical protein